MARLRNLGPASARMLKTMGVETRADLERVGPVLACGAVKDVYGGASLNLLYAMHGALTGERWDGFRPASAIDCAARPKRLRPDRPGS